MCNNVNKFSVHGNFRWGDMLVPQKKTRKGEECKGKMRRFNAAIARYVGGTTNSWACTRHWTRINREANSFCACPLPVHSTDISANIPARLYEMFDRIGSTTSGYRPGVRWCSRCRKNADQLFKDEQDYSPPGKVQLLGGYYKNAPKMRGTYFLCFAYLMLLIFVSSIHLPLHTALPTSVNYIAVSVDLICFRIYLFYFFLLICSFMCRYFFLLLIMLACLDKYCYLQSQGIEDQL